MAKITAKERKIREMERQDAEGISRKKWDHTINPNLFFMLKLLCIVLIPIFYFVYSPVLILLMIFYVFLFFLAIMAERRMNTSVIKKNHIHIPKFDCAIALIVIIIALSGSFMSSSSKSKASMFSNLDSSEITEFVGERNFDGAKTTSFWNTVSKWFINFGSCLTGERNMISSSGQSSFGFKDPPENMGEIDESEIERPSGGFGTANFDIDINDLPIDYTFSTILSTVNSILIFSVSIVGVLSLCYIYFRKRRFETEMNEVIFDNKITQLSDEELNKLLSFGENSEKGLSEKQIDEKFEEEVKEDLTQEKEDAKLLKEENKTNNLGENIEDKKMPEEEILALKKGYDINSVTNDIAENDDKKRNEKKE